MLLLEYQELFDLDPNWATGMGKIWNWNVNVHILDEPTTSLSIPLSERWIRSQIDLDPPIWWSPWTLKSSSLLMLTIHLFVSIWSNPIASKRVRQLGR